jgi:hypothetical protein
VALYVGGRKRASTQAHWLAGSAEWRQYPAQPPKCMPITCSLDMEMAERKLTNEALASLSGVHRSSIAKLRRNRF